ncbi:AMP-binding protein [Kaistia dalseonensis]|uniref:Acyl-[acyl-carrier-protein]-phospholipid O-acyltransferase/long-chain-fatty-acid--[acyl-carrier-protein] ligase n=1 Tax=Kaistia dalseonensis TaxID=410840 RepID=A0ABU0HB77_9HYPH|nr:AMP-binding protein [Kaistia dalseonensis]MCX5496941.1 AMP-binding protein [Kaistia dalseonensis]MDQ0439567.1 acyl-[acyl-carrier-protein]-phospholipid O-acyltransferase/long-chain-fatty-acid--[acyl-carrier-protein] ligase [Kaistia dalseonensis]
MDIATAIPSPATAAIPLDPRRWNKTLFQMLLDARARFGGKRIVMEDVQRKPLSLDRVIIGAFVLGRVFAKRTRPGECVGLLLPNVATVAPAFFGLTAFGRVPAMLNFTAGPKNLLVACKAAEIRHVITSRRFVAEGKLEELIAAIGAHVEFIWLEDIGKSVGTFDKLLGVASSMLSRFVHAASKAKPDDIAVMLFTSGSEGVPKGVALSHANILCNVEQFLRTLELSAEDSLFNPLPVFHSFGMTVGLIAPFAIGMRVFFYPTPLHYKQIPPIVAESGSTILIGTDTFAGGWGRMGEKKDFEKLRLVVLGAERIKDQTRTLWRDKFGIELFEGYGATEAAPVISANTPLYHRDGTVGRLLPGMSYRIEPVAGLDEGGRFWITGPNVMQGYLRDSAPGKLERTPDGWHDTGDIVSVDAEGYITIRGRAKRFAKIGGEMISLAAVEAYASQVWPDNIHAVVAVPDERKGEQLVLVTDRVDPDREALVGSARLHGIPEIMVPKRIVTVEALPMLGTGKTDYPAIIEIAKR